MHTFEYFLDLRLNTIPTVIKKIIDQRTMQYNIREPKKGAVSPTRVVVDDIDCMGLIEPEFVADNIANPASSGGRP